MNKLNHTLAIILLCLCSAAATLLVVNLARATHPHNASRTHLRGDIYMIELDGKVYRAVEVK